MNAQYIEIEGRFPLDVLFDCCLLYIYNFFAECSFAESAGVNRESYYELLNSGCARVFGGELVD